MGRRNKYWPQGGREGRKASYRCTWVSTMLTRTGILTVHFTTLLHISLCFKRTNCDVYSGDALFESAPRYRLSRRGVIMISNGLNTMCMVHPIDHYPFQNLTIYCSSVILPFGSIHFNTAKASYLNVVIWWALCECMTMLVTFGMFDRWGPVTRESGPGHCDAL